MEVEGKNVEELTVALRNAKGSLKHLRDFKNDKRWEEAKKALKDAEKLIKTERRRTIRELEQKCNMLQDEINFRTKRHTPPISEESRKYLTEWKQGANFGRPTEIILEYPEEKFIVVKVWGGDIYRKGKHDGEAKVEYYLIDITRSDKYIDGNYRWIWEGGLWTKQKEKQAHEIMEHARAKKNG